MRETKKRYLYFNSVQSIKKIRIDSNNFHNNNENLAEDYEQFKIDLTNFEN